MIVNEMTSDEILQRIKYLERLENELEWNTNRLRILRQNHPITAGAVDEKESLVGL